MNLPAKELAKESELKPRYLTKSRYKIGLECPTKLYYTGKKYEYADNRVDDPFLEALADGGFQVGELAKKYFPGGEEVTSPNNKDAEIRTNELLENDQVVIFEAAIRFENLFIRIDILVKDGNRFELIEVKSKSFDEGELDAASGAPFFGKRGGLDSSWAPYLHDVAFQNHVLAGKFPGASIGNYLMLADKNAESVTDGLNQKFRITRDENDRKGVKVHGSPSPEELAQPLLVKVPVDRAVEFIQGQVYGDGRNFAEEIRRLSDAYENDEKITPRVSRACKKCEFARPDENAPGGLRSGFRECWSEALGWTDADFAQPSILDIWRLHYQTQDKLIAQGKIRLADITKADLNVKENGEPGLSASERQWLQVKKSKEGDTSRYFDAAGFRQAAQSWQYPLHFIDFETAKVALPFTRGRKPYEDIAFQFSHHIVHENGVIEHAGEEIIIERGCFPNVRFMRKLKQQLDKDEGTIFRYAEHENTILNKIAAQLEEMPERADDFDELIKFIHSITTLKENKKTLREGPRTMVDMLDLVKRYYYDPRMGGSNSLKVVLPAVLNSSQYLQDKYSQPIYGAEDGIPSHNFPDGWTWVEFVDGIVKDPYKILPPLLDEASNEALDSQAENDEISDGGAAMTAYAKLQFEEITDDQRNALKNGLLRYCELDTFAMVMLYEAWEDWAKQST